MDTVHKMSSQSTNNRTGKEFPFQFSISCDMPKQTHESLECIELLRDIPKRRKVYDALWNNKHVVLKIFIHKFNAKRHLKREWKGLRRLLKCEINSPEPLFFGHTINNDWVIVTEKIDNSFSALELFYKSANWQEKLDLLIKISRQLAKQHIHGILQKDLHLGNFLIQDKQVYLIDAARIKFQEGEIGFRKSISQLAILAAWLPENQIHSIKKMCREYFKTRNWVFKKSDDIAFQKMLTAQRKRILRKGLKKCLRTNKRHLKIKDKDYIAEFNRDFCNESKMTEFIDKVDSLIETGQTIKEGKTSDVSSSRWADKDIVIKRYNHIGFIHSLRHTLKRSRACRCWLHGHRLEMLDIDTPKPLAYIEQRKRLLVWKSYLITEYTCGTNLKEFLKDNSNNNEERTRVTHNVLATLEKLWNYRITHGDLKHTNILIADNNPVLTDLDAMKIHMWNFLYKKFQKKDLLRFFQDKEAFTDLSINGYMPFVEKTHPIRELNEVFDETKVEGWRIIINKSYPLDIMKNLLKVNDLNQQNDKQFRKVPSSNYTCVYQSDINPDGSDTIVYIKKYLYRSWIDFIKHFFRSSRARREFNSSIMLNQNNFNTPEILCLAERRLGFINLDNLLVTKEIKDSISIPALMKDIHKNQNKHMLSRKHSLIESFALAIGKMHYNNIFHGDLRLNNVLVKEENSSWKFCFIDNERTRKCHIFCNRLRLKNLVQINLLLDGTTKADRLRFFKYYLRLNPDIRRNSLKWINKVNSKTKIRMRRKSKAWSLNQNILA